MTDRPRTSLSLQNPQYFLHYHSQPRQHLQQPRPQEETATLTLRPSSAQTPSTSIRSGDDESTVIHKTVLKWYQKAALPSLYHKKSFGSFFSRGRNSPICEGRARLGEKVPAGLHSCDAEVVYPGHPAEKDIDRVKRGEAMGGDDGGRDPNAVGWESTEGPDPQNPMEWAAWKKGVNFAVIFWICFTSPFTSSVFAPAVMDMTKDFGQTDIYLSAFVISVYVLGYAVGPLFIGPLSEIYGRLPLYHACHVIFLVFTLLCGISKNLQTLAAMRFFAGCGGSSAFTPGPASVADMVPFERRGRMYAVLGTAYNLGPAISPLVGSYVNDAFGWRWIFWLTGIMGGVCFLSSFLLSESYDPVLLRRKVARLRKQTGNEQLYAVCDTNRKETTKSQILLAAMLRPIRMLFLLPNVFFLSLVTAVGYGYMYILYTTISSIFILEYGFSRKTVGLVFLGSAIGNIMSMVIGGPLSDFIVRNRAAKGDSRPENRLIPMISFWPLVTVGFIVYGWTVEKDCAWYWPLIGTAIFGMGSMSAILFTGTYASDAYTVHSASAAAATTVLRALFGGLVPLFANKMYLDMGVGWVYTTLGLIALVMAPVPFYFYRWGEGGVKSSRAGL